MKAKPLPPLEILQNKFKYNPDTGVVTNRQRGREAGYKDKTGYRRISIDKKLYLTSRIVWKLVTGKDPEGTIDHIDRNKENNRFENLRDVTKQVQSENRKAKGYYKKGNRYEVRVRSKGAIVFCKLVKTEAEAIELRAKAKALYHKS